MKKLLTEINKALAAEPIVLVSVIAGSGSTPRGAGAMMLVRRDGRIAGTIGGGAVEFAAQKEAARIFEEKRSRTIGYNLAPNDVADLGMICGGRVSVYFQYIESGDMQAKAVFGGLYEALEKGAGAWLVRRIAGAEVTGMDMYRSDGTGLTGALAGLDTAGLLLPRAVFREGEPSYYAEPIVHAGRVYVFGGGHVAQELVPVIAHVGFSPVIFEDREDFARRELFRGVTETVLGDFAHFGEKVKVTADDYIVIMTRGHQADYEVLLQALRTPACYVGCIGSRTKMARVRQRLAEDGLSEAQIARIHNPIGLAILAETPAEIAISIAAELILFRAERQQA